MPLGPFFRKVVSSDTQICFFSEKWVQMGQKQWVQVQLRLVFYLESIKWGCFFILFPLMVTLFLLLGRHKWTVKYFNLFLVYYLFRVIGIYFIHNLTSRSLLFSVYLICLNTILLIYYLFILNLIYFINILLIIYFFILSFGTFLFFYLFRVSFLRNLFYHYTTYCFYLLLALVFTQIYPIYKFI